MKLPLGWTRLSPHGGPTCHLRLQHVDGWIIEHCGHPTANFPYSMRSPGDAEPLVVAANGHGFLHLKACFAAHFGLASGLLRLVHVYDEPQARAWPAARSLP